MLQHNICITNILIKLALIIFLSVVALSTHVAAKSSYYIELSAKPISNNEIEFVVKTNIPLPVKMAASVDLQNQKPEDVYIGYSKYIEISQSNQKFILDAKNKNLPYGNYNAEIAFYPLWGAENGNPEAAKIKNKIHASVQILLQGSSESVKEVQQKENLQKWIMQNVGGGTKWENLKFISKLGMYQELEVTNRNPEVVKAYYFPSADMTIFVIPFIQSVTTWRIGKISTL